MTQAMMQEDLENVYDWALINKMIFNDTKFEHLEYKTDRISNNSFQFFSESGEEIERPDKVKDLGVYMDSY